MSIIDPADFPIDPDLVDGTQLSEILNRLNLAIHSNNSNPTRPPELTAGGLWTKYTAPSTYQVLLYNGVSDVTLTVSGLAKGTSLANPFDGAVNYATGALIWDAASETLLSAKYPIASGGSFNAGDWNANAKVEGSFLHLTGGTITGPVAFSSLTPSRAVGINASGVLSASSATVTELSYLSGVTSAIQTQLNAKEDNVTGGATTILTANLTASRALVSDASGKVAVSVVTATEVGYLDGVTSSIQTQINAKTSWPGVYTGSSTSNTAYPVGTCVEAYNSNADRNEAATVYLRADVRAFDLTTTTGGVLAGTWRGRGLTGASSGSVPCTLMQRTA
jgi:hypothetical protein